MSPTKEGHVGYPVMTFFGKALLLDAVFMQNIIESVVMGCVCQS